MLRALVVMMVAGGVVATEEQAWGQRAPVGFYRLGVPEGYRYTDLTSMSGNGLVASGIARGASGPPLLLEWSYSGGVATAATPASMFYWETTGASRDGIARVGTAFTGGRNQPIVWTSGSMPVALGVPGQWTHGWCEGISGDGGTVVGRAYTTSGASEFGEPFRWTAATGIRGMGIVPGSTHGSAFAATCDGSLIVGGANDSQGAGRGFVWTEDAGYQLIAEAYRIEAVSANGAWFGGVLQNSSPFRMDGNGGIVDMDPLSLLSSGVTTGVSLDGRVAIGRGSWPGEVQTSFVWTAERGLERIAEFLAAEGIAVPTGFTFSTQHIDVSEDGLVFAGTAVNELGKAEGWVAVIPAPATGGAFALWLFTAGRRRR